MFIQRDPAAIFACTFTKTLYTSSATANLTLMALIIHNWNVIYLKFSPSVFFKDTFLFLVYSCEDNSQHYSCINNLSTTHEPCSVERGGGFSTSAKSIDPCQPAQFAQADMGRNLSLSLDFLRVKRPLYTPSPRCAVGCVGGTWDGRSMVRSTARPIFFPRVDDSHWLIATGQGSFRCHRCPLFRRWLWGKAVSGLKRTLCRVLVKRTPGKYR